MVGGTATAARKMPLCISRRAKVVSDKRRAGIRVMPRMGNDTACLRHSLIDVLPSGAVTPLPARDQETDRPPRRIGGGQEAGGQGPRAAFDGLRVKPLVVGDGKVSLRNRPIDPSPCEVRFGRQRVGWAVP